MNTNLTIGRIVRYTLTEADASAITKRRQDYSVADKSVDTGFQAHVGNPVKAGDVYPLMITRVNGADVTASVNGQVFLDGNDVFWATSRAQGEGPGTWSWPEHPKPKAKKVKKTKTTAKEAVK